LQSFKKRYLSSLVRGKKKKRKKKNQTRLTSKQRFFLIFIIFNFLKKLSTKWTGDHSQE
jgi:hypothetical protein